MQGIKTAEEMSVFMKEHFSVDLGSMIEKEVGSRLALSKNGIEAKILALKTKGMTTGGIQQILKADGIDASRTQIGHAIEETLPQMHEWVTRPLARVYPIVFLDGMRCSVRESGKTVAKCSYHALGVNMDGEKELLGIWIADTEGAKFWMQVLTDLKNRGVEDILICCIDGLKGFSQAIKAVFPNATIQQCVNHMIRSTGHFVKGHRKEKFCGDLKEVYTAPTEEAGRVGLTDMMEKWPDFKPFLVRWEKEWSEIAPYFAYSAPVRRLIYTTNPIESLHSQFRREIKTVNIFTSDESLRHHLWLAQLDITKKWTGKPLKDWGEIIAQLSIMYPDRLVLY